ncbi:MAG: hypothetical protein ACOX21_08830 [Bacillota bacterium]
MLELPRYGISPENRDSELARLKQAKEQDPGSAGWYPGKPGCQGRRERGSYL